MTFDLTTAPDLVNIARSIASDFTSQPKFMKHDCSAYRLIGLIYRLELGYQHSFTLHFVPMTLEATEPKPLSIKSIIQRFSSITIVI